MSGEWGTDLYAVIAERAPIGLLVLDDEGSIEWTNDEYSTLLGVSRPELIGTPFRDLVAAGFYDESLVDRYFDTVRLLLSSTSDETTANYLVETHFDDGETMVHDVSTTLLPLEDGAFAGTMHAFRDVTDRIDAERALERQNERLDAFASVVSHDLRNPLNVAVGNLDLVREDLPEERYAAIASSLDRIDQLVTDVLLLARAGAEVGDLESLDLGSVAATAWDHVAGTETASFDRSDGLGTIRADRSRLTQLFENLFRNAVEYGGSTVTVRVEATDDGFVVADDGPGVPPEERSAVFDEGYSTNDDGTGLGLSIVQSIVDGHGWTIDVDDGADGGVRFVVSGVAEAESASGEP